MNNSANNIHKVLAVEDSEDILEFVLPESGILLWPYIRYYILTELYNSISAHDSPLTCGATRSGNTLSPIKNYIKNIITFNRRFFRHLDSLFLPWPRRDIWYISNIGSEYYKFEDGEYIDIYNDLYAKLTENKSMYISMSFSAKKQIRKKCFPYRFIQSIVAICDKFAKYAISDADRKRIFDFIFFLQKRIQKYFPTECNHINFIHFKKQLEMSVGYSILLNKFLRPLFTCRQPKAIILTDALYGSHYITKLAKELGIVTIELQHGIACRGHFAYTWSDTLCQNSLVKNQTVDYFLTYGEFWNDHIHIPSTKIAIGNAWFSICKEQHRQISDGILFILQLDFNIFVEYIRVVSKIFPEKKIYVRPHPAYYDIITNHSIFTESTIILDKSKKIYDTLKFVNTVIGQTSTSLVEAFELGKCVIALRSTGNKFVETLFNDMGIRFFSNPEEMVSLIREKNSRKVTGQTQKEIFSTNWKENYCNFINTNVYHTNTEGYPSVTPP